MRAYFFTALFMIASLSGFGAELTVEQQTAKTQGIVLYNQFKAISATTLLKIAADAGDHDAQYYLGESIRKNKRYMTTEALGAYEASALQGDIYSMIRLAGDKNDLCVAMSNCPKGRKEPKEWKKMALDTASAESAKGNEEAMYLMFKVTGDDKWLEKAANHGFPLAQFRLATKYKEGGGFFLTPSSRAEAVERWMKASAVNGYPPGMMGLAAIFVEKQDLSNFKLWNEKAAASGFVEGVFGYGSYLGGDPSNLGFKTDLIKSYALLSLLFELDGGGGVRRDVEDVLPDISKKMSAEQIAEAERFAESWKSSHPPLSFSPEKLGD
ncbi:sel1 repeat family protein [Pseudomonas sp. TH03]|nr:sel1 repeat family protein [Pseudomonas sp. TH03]